MPLQRDPIEEARRNWARAGWDAVDAMSAATSVTRAHQILLRRIDDVLAPFGLTFSRFEALALLAFSASGALPLGKMGQRLLVHPTSVTNTVDRLERDGLVQRLPHPEDRRTTLAEITPDGRRLVEKAAAALAGVSFGFEDAPVDVRALDEALRPLREHAGDW